MTLHQGAIEAIFLDSMREFGLDVSRPAIPVSLQLSEDALELKDPEAYPVRVRSLSPVCMSTFVITVAMNYR